MKKYFITQHQLAQLMAADENVAGEHQAILQDVKTQQEIVEDPDVMSVSWSIQDVQAERPDLSDDQARDVLAYVIDNHDANNGVNWEAINYASYVLFGDAPEAAEKKEEESV